MHPLLKKKRGSRPRKGIVRRCLFCGIEVYRLPCKAHLKKTFCTKKHSIEWKIQGANKGVCVVCKGLFRAEPYKINIQGVSSCSRECSAKELRRKTLIKRDRLGYTKHQLDRLARYSKEAILWRKLVFARDNYTCQGCHKRGSYLEADHIKPFAYFPELRYILSNGRTLCRPCHDKTKIGYKKMRQLYGI